MTDEAQGQTNPEPPPTPEQAAPDEAKRSSIPPWAWVVGAVLIVAVLLGLYSTQTEQGRAWMLGLRSMVAVPSVVGQTQPQAQAALEAAGLRVGQVSQEPTLAVPPGTVVGQTPAADSAVKKDSAVDISVASVPTAQVPDVVGQLQSDAITALAEQGLRTGTVSYVYDSAVQAGKTTAQTPAASEKVAVGSAVNLTVSMGAQQGQVPNVIGLSQDDANAVITAAGFTVTTVKGASDGVPPGDVSAQSPAAGVVTAAGSTVTITVSTGPAPASAPAPSTPAPAPAPETPPAPAPPSEPTKPTEPPATTVKVPDVIGKSVKDAVDALKSVKLKVSFAFAPSDGDYLKVIKQDPDAGAAVDPGTTVTITISLPSISLPDNKPTQPMPLPAEKPAQQPAEQPAPTTQPSAPATP